MAGVVGVHRPSSRRGLLDYDDLILATLDLLRAEGGANWVLYKLDGGLDHILVDEAQDTSAEQWAVVEALASEFFSGGGTNKNHARTLFVVGDEKQSIYSFQGADPEGFERMRKIFARRLRDIGDRLVEVELALSFRSAPTIVRAVDAVFARTKLTETAVASRIVPIGTVRPACWNFGRPSRRATRRATAPGTRRSTESTPKSGPGSPSASPTRSRADR